MRAHTHLLRSHENVYSDPCSSFLCLGLSTLLAPRMVFDRALRLYPQARGCSRLRLYPPRSDHQFRGATSYNGRTPLWNAREKRVGLQIFVAGEQVSIPLSPPLLQHPLSSEYDGRGLLSRMSSFSDRSYPVWTPLVILSRIPRFSWYLLEFLANSIATN